MSWREPRPVVFGGPLTPGVRTLVFVTIGVYIFQLVAGWLAQVRLERLFGLVPYEVVHHLFLWQMGTYLFLHGGFFHILFNMLGLWMFGNDLEELWGTQRFVRFYFITGVGAALCSVLVSPNSTIPIIGASGAIYGILAAYGILFPERTLLLYFVIPIKAKYFVLILGALAFWATLTSTGGGVANVAHLGGLLFGWLYMRRFGRGAGPGMSFRWRNPIREWRERVRRNKLRKKFKVYYRNTRGEDDGGEE